MLELMRSLINHGGVTLRNGKEILYKSGWQVADYGVECKTAEDAAKAIENMNGNCGVWFENGVYYVDHSFRVILKRKRLKSGGHTIKFLSMDGRKETWPIVNRPKKD